MPEIESFSSIRTNSKWNGQEKDLVFKLHRNSGKKIDKKYPEKKDTFIKKKIRQWSLD